MTDGPAPQRPVLHGMTAALEIQERVVSIVCTFGSHHEAIAFHDSLSEQAHREGRLAVNLTIAVPPDGKA